ncbi:hypothetical protein LFT51_12795 [Mycobacterium intracellulare subsp. chimaera]|uniref:hypothetical protein n=1 Tax=Mycobacterium intracellulare TaxID=1767 RepID=UPI0006CA8103|nr:hypothetical protein [Mycobacterium intracellulare]ARV82056.1 hypothetical protein BWK49_12785 [Mycobacterium intracellulare subsp. chimaera]ASL09172.1 hypothetical protein MYCODSM44623_02441 [Mycobacterium intracellulare subsp. chimaera]ASL20987.1 hypothetical protein MYCOZU1_02564 [Mycobacterium intracellulare subsp. chimaera]KPN46084.1 hypothetical protein AN931_26310 [Mycobacterium intracellulare subsp. chimaera]KPN51824.1 hypothetical protein AN932_09355 [Mycobacterium intracellulare s
MSPSLTARRTAEANTGAIWSSTDKWRRDHERRAARAAVDPRYYDMMPLGVRLRANMIRAQLSA